MYIHSIRAATASASSGGVARAACPDNKGCADLQPIVSISSDMTLLLAVVCSSQRLNLRMLVGDDGWCDFGWRLAVLALLIAVPFGI